MSDERWARLRELFAEVQGMAQDERRAYLDRELDGELQLRAELDALLEAEATAGGFLAPNDDAGGSRIP